MKELDVDGLVAVTLDFDIKTSGLNPKLGLIIFSPNVTYKMAGNILK